MNDVEFSPDGRLLAFVGMGEDAVSSIKIWDIAAGKDGAILTGNKQSWAIDADFHPDGKRLASVEFDFLDAPAAAVIRLWDLTTLQNTVTLGHKASRLTFSPNGGMLASGGSDGIIKLWDGATLHEIATFVAHEDSISSITFSPDGRRLASSGFDRTVKFWDVATGQNFLTLVGHKDVVTSVEFDPSGQILASTSWDGTVMLWDAATGRNLATLRGHRTRVNEVKFSHDGQTLASAGELPTLFLWNVKTVLDSTSGDLMNGACNWLRGYLQNNPNVADRTLCDDV